MNNNALKKGDILLAHNTSRKHAAIYIGDGQIVNASLNEKGTTTGGKPGDQTGREIRICPNYGEWDFVFRYPDERVATAAALFAVSIANDDSHGYDQRFRWNEKGDYDCSSLTVESYQRQGIKIKENGGTFTGNLAQALKKCGFMEVNDMVKCIVELVEVYPGDEGEAVRAMQALLNLRGYYCGQTDGDYGSRTKSSLDRYQRDHHLTPYDYICGRGTWSSLINNK